MERSRTFNWEDPLAGAGKAMHMDGMAYLQAMVRGEIAPPPVILALDFRLESIRSGEVIFAFTPQEFHYNPIGTVHGGVVTALLDSAMGCTLQTLLPAGTGYTTLELKVNFLRPATLKSGELRAVGKVIHSGSRTALVEAQLTDADNKVYAHAVSTCLLLKA